MERRTQAVHFRRLSTFASMLPALLGLAAVLVQTAAPSPAVAELLTVGVVRDGPSADDVDVDRIEAEVTRLARDAEVRFKRDPAFDGAWDPARMRNVLKAALADREVDVVLVVGALTLQEAAVPDLELTKPVVSATELRADFFRDPAAKGPFLKKNLSITMIPRGAARDIESFRTLLPFDRVHLLVDAISAEHLRALPSVVAAYSDSLGVEIVLVPVTGVPSDDVSTIGNDVEAILMGSLPRHSETQRSDLIDGLIARQLPVFSIHGHSDVELGAAAAYTPDITELLARRVALNINQIARGTAVEQLPVILPVESQLLLNGRTLKELGVELDYMTLARAEVLHAKEIAADLPVLTLDDALDVAEQSNLPLMVVDKDVEVAEQDANIARSPLLPQIGAGATYSGADPQTLAGLLPDRQTRAGFAGSQMIYDDRRVSDFRAQKRLYESTQENREAVRLDVLQDAGLAYLDYVRARVLFDVVSSNLALSIDHLGLAKRRYDVGYSGRDEVFRWEAEVAEGQAALLDAATGVEERRIVLNQILGIDQSNRWLTEKIVVDSDVFPFLDGRLESVFGDRRLWANFREFAVAFAAENAPELSSFSKSAEARGIQLGQRKRSFFVPSLDVRGQWDYVLYRDPAFDDIPNDFYRFEIAASLPLFEGARRVHDVKRFSADLEGIEREMRLTHDLVERRTRTTLRQVESSFPIVGLTRQAAASSRSNLDVVRDKYALGLVNVTDLLEAQNKSFSADASAATSVYDFLADLIQLQRALAWFERDHTAAERDELIRQIMGAVNVP